MSRMSRWSQQCHSWRFVLRRLSTWHVQPTQRLELVYVVLRRCELTCETGDDCHQGKFQEFEGQRHCLVCSRVPACGDNNCFSGLCCWQARSVRWSNSLPRVRQRSRLVGGWHDILHSVSSRLVFRP